MRRLHHHTRGAQRRQWQRSAQAWASPSPPSVAVQAREPADAASQLLDKFWEARGVASPQTREQLVRMGLEGGQSDRGACAALDVSDRPLPGVPVTWHTTLSPDSSTPEELLEVSHRLLQLQAVLGGPGEGASSAAVSAEELVFMVQREPALLTTDVNQLLRRLLEMNVAAAGTGTDVVRLVVRQPALLTTSGWALDLAAVLRQGSTDASEQQQEAQRAADGAGEGGVDEMVLGPSTPWQPPSLTLRAEHQHSAVVSRGSGGDGGTAPAWPARAGGSQAGAGATESSIGGEQEDDGGGVRELLRAWEHGLSADGDKEWQASLQQLSAYVQAHGDASVGYREQDDAQLGRWAAKQRADARQGRLSEQRRAALAGVGFEWDDDEAEWVRWYSELAAFKAAHGHCSPWPLSQGVDLRLINWAGVQRIARRSRVLSEARVRRLDQLGFDWSGADPLS